MAKKDPVALQLEAQHAQHALEFLEPLLEAEKSRILTRPFALLQNGDPLDERIAVAAVTELHTHERIREMLRRHVRRAQKDREGKQVLEGGPLDPGEAVP